MHPVQERLWMNQQRMQEVHRRRLYHRSSLHHGLVSLLLYSIYKVGCIYKLNFLVIWDHVICIHQRNTLVAEMETTVLRALGATIQQITQRIRKIIFHLRFYRHRSNPLFTVILKLGGRLIFTEHHALCYL